MRIRAATRGSALARWQTDRLIGLLNAVRPDVDVEVVVVQTTGDLDRDHAPNATKSNSAMFYLLNGNKINTLEMAELHA